MHVGRPAMWPNLLVAGETTPPIAPIPCAAAQDENPINSNSTLRIRFS